MISHVEDDVVCVATRRPHGEHEAPRILHRGFVAVVDAVTELNAAVDNPLVDVLRFARLVVGDGHLHIDAVILLEESGTHERQAGQLRGRRPHKFLYGCGGAGSEMVFVCFGCGFRRGLRLYGRFHRLGDDELRQLHGCLYLAVMRARRTNTRANIFKGGAKRRRIVVRGIEFLFGIAVVIAPLVEGRKLVRPFSAVCASLHDRHHGKPLRVRAKSCGQDGAALAHDFFRIGGRRFDKTGRLGKLHGVGHGGHLLGRD